MVSLNCRRVGVSGCVGGCVGWWVCGLVGVCVGVFWWVWEKIAVLKSLLTRALLTRSSLHNYVPTGAEPRGRFEETILS